MKPEYSNKRDWQLARERFRIAESRLPKPLRPEKTIGAILSEIQKAEPVADTIPEILQERWAAIAGEQIAKHTTPVYLRGSQLIVYADHPGWLTQVRRLPAAHLLKKIAVIPDAPAVKEIRFQLDPALRTHPRRK